jgi:tRNA acetyltransferase TAN1
VGCVGVILKDFNLLVTTARGNEEDACSEIWYLIGQIGDSANKVEKTGITGLIAVKTELNPFRIIEEFRKILNDRPFEFRYAFRVIPVERVVHTEVVEIQKTVQELSNKINEDETFRVTVEKRFTTTSTRDIIEAAASNIQRRVDLHNPNKIILIEVVGGLTGVSIVKPEEILSIVKERT